MATVRFGAKCDRCGAEHNNYSVEDIANCENCGLDLCDVCAADTNHVVVRDWDVDQSRLRSCDLEPAIEGVK